jgi:hypothetical protein
LDKEDVMGKNDKDNGRSVQWFAECGNPLSNERLAEALAGIGMSEAECKHPAMEGSDGKTHDVWQIPGRFVKALKIANQADIRLSFRFFKRNGSKGIISPADFVEKRKKSRKLLDAKKRLGELQAAKAGK